MRKALAWPLVSSPSTSPSASSSALAKAASRPCSARDPADRNTGAGRGEGVAMGLEEEATGHLAMADWRMA